MNATTLPTIGHNAPPKDSIIAAESEIAVISEYLRLHPVIVSEDDAKLATAIINEATRRSKDMDAERDAIVRPFNEHVKKINGEFKTTREILDRLKDQVKARLDKWLIEADMTRQNEVAAAEQEFIERQKALHEAEQAEFEAQDKADAGEPVDLGKAITKTAHAVAELEQARQKLLEAQKNDRTWVRDENGGRTISRRTVETLNLDDPVAAVREVIRACNGAIPEKLAAAILTEARAYRREFGELPAGVTATTTKTV